MRTSLLLFCIMAFNACNTNQNLLPKDRIYIEQTKELNLKDFTEIAISGASTATIQKGDFRIIVTGDSTDLTLLKPRVENNRFLYTLSEQNIRHFGLKFQIYLPNLNFLDVSGASKATIGKFGNDNFAATISGASELNAFDNPTKTININASGASKVQISVSEILIADVSGASKLFYRGSPAIKSNITGASTIQQD
jgi:Putative auto-transporter adhesin, head GIN domain